MALTDTMIRSTKPSTAPIRLSDSNGLYLLLNPNGSRWWRFDYRFAGKRKTLSLGTYPDTGLKFAREKRDAARKLLASGIDPSAKRQAEKVASADTFESIAPTNLLPAVPGNTLHDRPRRYSLKSFGSHPGIAKPLAFSAAV
jgi:hypothetical protein